MKLQSSLYNHFTALFSLLFFTVIALLFLWIVEFKSGFVISMSVFFLIDLIPVVYLHLHYLLANRDSIYEVLPEKIIYKEKGEKIHYPIDDIEAIRIYRSANMDKWGLPILGMESYGYARVYLKSGEELIITCLLSTKLEEVLGELKGVPFERKKRAFNPIWWK